jgi:hypothetical protein
MFLVLLQYMQWREENEIDKILEWEPSEDLKKTCPYEISFHDREGRPGKLLLKSIVVNCNKEKNRVENVSIIYSSVLPLGILGTLGVY